MAQPPSTAEREPDVDAGRRPPGGTGTTVVVLLLAGLFLAWSSLTLLELDVHRYTVALVALRQYAAPVGVVLALLALVLRRWLTALVVGLATVMLFVSVVPRAVPDQSTAVQGHQLRVLSINLHLGEGDARHVVRLVRQHRVDVLSVQELSHAAARNLNRAGLHELLPFRVFQPEQVGAGTGIASRYPLRQLPLVPPTTLRQPAASMRLPEQEIEIVAVHPMYPVGADTTADWRRELAALPDPATGDAGTPRVLAGDFNATVDHTPMRRLLGKGYQDAAGITGDGLLPTWPGADGPVTPPVTIDHVLVSGGIGVRGFQVFDVPRTDHRAVLAHLVVPQ